MLQRTLSALPCPTPLLSESHTGKMGDDGVGLQDLRVRSKATHSGFAGQPSPDPGSYGVFLFARAIRRRRAVSRMRSGSKARFAVFPG